MYLFLFSRSKSHQRNLVWMLAGFYKRNVNKLPHVLCTMRWVFNFPLSKLKGTVISRWERSLLRTWYILLLLTFYVRPVLTMFLLVSYSDSRRRTWGKESRKCREHWDIGVVPISRLDHDVQHLSVIDRASLECYFLWYTPFYFSFSCQVRNVYRAMLVLLCAQSIARSGSVIALDV